MDGTLASATTIYFRIVSDFDATVRRHVQVIRFNSTGAFKHLKTSVVGSPAEIEPALLRIHVKSVTAPQSYLLALVAQIAVLTYCIGRTYVKHISVILSIGL
jgi:hypothetical protein